MQFSFPKSLPAKHWMQLLIYWALALQQGDSPKEKQLPSGSAVGQGRVVHITCGLQIPAWTPLNARVQANEVRLAWEQSYLAALLCSGLTRTLKSSMARKPSACVAASLLLLNLTLETENTCFFKKLMFLPSAASLQSCCAALVLTAPAAA